MTYEEFQNSPLSTYIYGDYWTYDGYLYLAQRDNTIVNINDQREGVLAELEEEWETGERPNHQLARALMMLNSVVFAEFCDPMYILDIPDNFKVRTV
jgi:hypothetical protein